MRDIARLKGAVLVPKQPVTSLDINSESLLNTSQRRIEIQDLKSVHESVRKLYPHDYLDEGLGAIGLFLYQLPANRAYSVTPVNSVTFGGIGLDGIHFGSITDTSEVDPLAPIVMSVPNALETANFIVGDTLYDFLCLGSRHGFAQLGNLHLNREEVVRHYEAPPGAFFDNRSEAILRSFSDSLSLTSWISFGDKLEQLQDNHLKTLRWRTQS